jgi:hypothetical protein
MQHIREILRQKLALGRSHREVAKSLGVSPSTVAGVFSDAWSLGLDAAAVEALTDAELRRGCTRSRSRHACGPSRTARPFISSCADPA